MAINQFFNSNYLDESEGNQVFESFEKDATVSLKNIGFRVSNEQWYFVLYSQRLEESNIGKHKPDLTKQKFQIAFQG